MLSIRGVIAAATVAASVPLTAQSPIDVEISAHLARIGAQVGEYFSRVQSLICRESVRMQPLRNDLMPEGRSRHLVYELRVEWIPPPDNSSRADATIQRELLEVDGRPAGPSDRPGCMDPKPVSPEPLAMLLPARQHEFLFALVGTDRMDGRTAIVLDYRPRSTADPTVTWRQECVSIDLLSMTRGRVWADAATGEVLRLDESLTGIYEFPVPFELRRPGSPLTMIVERSDTTIRYRPVRFADPDEEMMLPDSIETLTIVRRAGVPRQRTVQTFSGYQRFMTSGRIVR